MKKKKLYTFLELLQNVIPEKLSDEENKESCYSLIIHNLTFLLYIKLYFVFEKKDTTW